MNSDENTDSTRVEKGHNNRENNMYTDQTVNNLDWHGNVPLHNAVIQDDEEMLSNLLQHNCIDLNFKNYKGETPLLLAIRMYRPYSFIMQLIHSGADLNITNKFGQNSLHVALLCCEDNNVLHELIKNGADIDAQDLDERTPLHYAVEDDNMEAVCMLLCYAADVSILNNENKTPFSLAVCHNRIEIAKVLFDYYDDFSDADCDGYTALHLAIWQQNPIALDLVKAGADVNCITDDDQNPLDMCVENMSMELFELIWPKFNYHLLLNSEIPFLHTFIQWVKFFSAYEWLKAIYLVLNCPVLFDLLNNCKNYSYENYGCFSNILPVFSNFNVKLCDRLNIITTLLSLGAEIRAFDINLVLILYGFNEELEFILYCTDYYAQHNFCNVSPLPQYSFIFSTDDSSILTVFQLFKQFLEKMSGYHVDNKILEKCLLNNLGFFSLSVDQKNKLCMYYVEFEDYIPAVIDKINALPEFPSLVELSRNQARKSIMETFKITRAYQFHDIVKKLKLPYCIQDILRFKTPLY